MNVIENENTEFKREYTSDIKKTVVAFANSKGGTIYIGISDDGEIIGVDDLDQTLQNALNSIRDPTRAGLCLDWTFAKLLQSPVAPLPQDPCLRHP
jgi:ATP-dependent DNA helicase RecG